MGSSYVYVIDNSVEIPSGVTLTIAQGAIVKYANGSISVQSGGKLNVAGTSTNKVVFTSYKDDTVGGDSNGDGVSSVAGVTDYDAAVTSQSGSTTTVSNAVFRDANYALRTQNGTGTVTVSDSTFNSSAAFDGGTVSLKRNQFALDYAPAILATRMEMSGVILSGTDQNTFTGTGRGRTIELGQNGGYNTVASGKSWTVAGTSGAVLTTYNSSIEVAGTLNLQAGTILKSVGGNGTVLVDASGKLNVAGTSTNKVVFTSYKDDTVGGDSNGDGSTTIPETGDYTNAITDTDSTDSVTMSNATISYAGISLYANGGKFSLDSMILSNSNIGISAYAGNVIYRGRFSNIQQRAIQACNWGAANCGVDATYTDWGTVAGPNSAGAATVCGQVDTLPWIHGASTYNGASVFIPNCDNSLTPDTQLTNSITGFQQRVSQKTIDCGNGFEDACEAMHQAYACLSGAVNLAASTIPFPVPSIETDGSGIGSYGSAVSESAHDYLLGKAVKAVGGSTIGEIFGPLYSAYKGLSDAYGAC